MGLKNAHLGRLPAVQSKGLTGRPPLEELIIRRLGERGRPNHIFVFDNDGGTIAPLFDKLIAVAGKNGFGVKRITPRSSKKGYFDDPVVGIVKLSKKSVRLTEHIGTVRLTKEETEAAGTMIEIEPSHASANNALVRLLGEAIGKKIRGIMSIPDLVSDAIRMAAKGRILID